MDHKANFVELNLVTEYQKSKSKATKNDKEKHLLPDSSDLEDSTTSKEISLKKTIKISTSIPNPHSIQLLFGGEVSKPLRLEQNKRFGKNRISTTKYNIFSWFPKTLLMQFRRIANIYFLIITILECMPFSPKKPQSQILSFGMVLLFSMIKEAIEDIKRYKMDNEINNKITVVYNRESNIFEQRQFQDLIVGDIVKISKNNTLPADLLLIKSSLSSGLCFVDTKDLDGETNLKEKMINTNLLNLDEETLIFLNGKIRCSEPNELMESWEANISIEKLNLSFSSNIKNLLLKGSVLRNTEYVYGLVIYCGHNTKIMMNAKKPPLKMSNVVKLMNALLISIFLFLVIMSAFFSLANLVFNYENKQYITIYISLNAILSVYSLAIQFLTFVVAYSHLIPISLYVSMEIVKLMQSWFIFYDEFIYDKVSGKPTYARTSELIEELGQVDIVFSDKTGTLTQNSMEFKKCLVKETIYGDVWADDTKRCINYDKEKKHINGDTKAYDIITSDTNDYPSVINTNSEKAKLMEFFLVASVCHSALAEKDESGDFKYSSMSPDEIALINGAKDMGFIFIERTAHTIEVMNNYTSKSEVWEVLYELPFDSDRKRMTMFVKNIEDKNNVVFVLSKGADNIMLPRLNLTESGEKCATDALYKFSCEGLRTLILAMKTIDYQIFNKWYSKVRLATLKEDKIEKENDLNKLHDEMETNLNIAGVSAIEDKLQEGVPETIELLLNSGIRVWVLTGDKKETALNIGRTCRLIEEIGVNDIDITSDNLDMNSNNFNAEIERKLDSFISHLNISHVKDISELKKMKLKEKYYMIVDGFSLIKIIECPNLSYKFLVAGLMCRSVICCRVSPKQKSDVVKIARKLSNWITLSIGDGANDVPMIMEANIGVGIQGKEGSQAVRSADYAMCQFKFLQRLLLIHGRNGYRRISKFICYYFYKNIVLVFAEIYFVFFSGYSGQIFFPDMLTNLYNILWTSWPCILAFSIDKDIIEDKPDRLSIQNYKNNLIGKYFEIFPHFYKAGHTNYYFTLRVFWKWIISAIIHGGICFTSVSIGLLDESVFSNGELVDHWWIATIIFTLIVHVVTYKIFVEMSYWNKLVLSISTMSVIFYYACILLLNTPMVSYGYGDEFSFKVYSILSSYVAYIYFLTIPIFCVSIDLGINFIGQINNPSPLDIVKSNKLKINNDLNIVRRLTAILDPKDVYEKHKERNSFLFERNPEKKPAKW